MEEHLSQLEVLQRISTAGLKISPKKCSWFHSSVKFLGHIVSGNGVKTDPEKISAIMDWPIPKKLKEVHAFLGFCSYYRRFIRGFAQIARPLHNLTEKDKPFERTESCDHAFRELKVFH